MTAPCPPHLLSLWSVNVKSQISSSTSYSPRSLAQAASRPPSQALIFVIQELKHREQKYPPSHGVKWRRPPEDLRGLRLSIAANVN